VFKLGMEGTPTDSYSAPACILQDSALVILIGWRCMLWLQTPGNTQEGECGFLADSEEI
jgi:hypothetical protein